MMYRANTLLGLTLGTALMAVGLLFEPAEAVAADNNSVHFNARFGMYEEAIEANNKCVKEATQAQEDRAVELGLKAQRAPMVGDLLATVNVKRGSTRVARYSLGCSSPYIIDRLNFYNSNIMPNL